MSAGKGDRPRPVDREKWESGWERVFGGSRDDPIPIGIKTKQGKVVGYRFDGERFYILECPGGVTALMPADIIEGG